MSVFSKINECMVETVSIKNLDEDMYNKLRYLLIDRDKLILGFSLVDTEVESGIRNINYYALDLVSYVFNYGKILAVVHNKQTQYNFLNKVFKKLGAGISSVELEYADSILMRKILEHLINSKK